MSSMRKENDLVDTRSRLIAYPSAVVGKLANILFPHRITGAIKAPTHPANESGDRDCHRFSCNARNANRLGGRLAGQVDRINSTPTADVPNHRRITAL
jgi:hypothetical protein